MFFSGKRKATIAPVFAAALGVFLLANGAPPAPGLSPLILQAATPQTASLAIDPTCRLILDATHKLFTTPYHMFMTQTNAMLENGKPIGGEAILTGGTQYILVNGKWQASPMSMDEVASLRRRAIR